MPTTIPKSTHVAVWRAVQATDIPLFHEKRREEWNLLGHGHSRHSSRLPNPNTAFSASPDPKPGFGASCLKPEGVSYIWLAGGPQSVLWDPGASPVPRRVRCYQKCLGQRNRLGKEVSPMTWLAARWAGDEGEAKYSDILEEAICS